MNTPRQADRKRRGRPAQLETATPIVAMVVARQVVEEAANWLGAALPSRYAAGLAQRARRVFAHSAPYRRRMAAGGDDGREWVYALMRHWLAARLQEERPAWFARLPKSFALGEALPARTECAGEAGGGVQESEGFVSPEARLIAGW